MSPARPHEIDWRGRDAGEAGRAVIEHYNRAGRGGQFTVLLDDYTPGLRIRLLEAGVRHAARDRDGDWQLTITRGAVPAQGSVPGVHHVVAGRDGSVWGCERAHRVVRIDGVAGTMAAVNAVARQASHLALDAARDRLYVADPGDNAIIALRASDLRIVGRWQAPGAPQLPLVTESGIVCVTGPGTGTLTIIRPLRDRHETQTVAVGACPHDPEATSDGEAALVPCAGEGAVVKVRLTDGKLEGKTAVGAGPSHLAADRAADRYFVANSFDGTLVRLTAGGVVEAKAQSGGWAHAVTVTQDGSKVFVANFLDDTLAVFDARTLERVALLPTESYAHGLDLSPDGRYVIATGFASEHIRIYDAATHAELGRVEVGWGSSHSAVVGSRAYIGCSVSGHVAVVDLEARNETDRIRLH